MVVISKHFRTVAMGLMFDINEINASKEAFDFLTQQTVRTGRSKNWVYIMVSEIYF